MSEEEIAAVTRLRGIIDQMSLLTADTSRTHDPRQSKPLIMQLECGDHALHLKVKVGDDSDDQIMPGDKYNLNFMRFVLQLDDDKQ